MSPEMETEVAAVEVERWEADADTVERGEGSGGLGLRRERSDTRLEKDMVLMACEDCRWQARAEQR